MIFNCPLLIRALFFARFCPFTKAMKEKINYIPFMLVSQTEPCNAWICFTRQAAVIAAQRIKKIAEQEEQLD